MSHATLEHVNYSTPDPEKQPLGWPTCSAGKSAGKALL